jgi:triosephosphate isomerase
MLAKLDVSYVIVGHSERRELFGETDEVVNAKARAVLGHAMTPIVCVGETIEERNAGNAQSKVEGQIAGSLAGIEPAAVGGLVVAYEPIWAIGTGQTATPEDAQEMCGHVRSVVGERFGAEAAAALRIQYGGSVKPSSAPDLMAQPDIDGALVGGASLDADDFSRIVNYRLYQA